MSRSAPPRVRPSGSGLTLPLGWSGPKLKPGTVRVYTINGSQNSLNIGRKDGLTLVIIVVYNISVYIVRETLAASEHAPLLLAAGAGARTRYGISICIYIHIYIYICVYVYRRQVSPETSTM